MEEWDINVEEKEKERKRKGKNKKREREKEQWKDKNIWTKYLYVNKICLFFLTSFWKINPKYYLI